jgi:hypothetical protein
MKSPLCGRKQILTRKLTHKAHRTIKNEKYLKGRGNLLSLRKKGIGNYAF